MEVAVIVYEPDGAQHPVPLRFDQSSDRRQHLWQGRAFKHQPNNVEHVTAGKLARVVLMGKFVQHAASFHEFQEVTIDREAWGPVCKPSLKAMVTRSGSESAFILRMT